MVRKGCCDPAEPCTFTQHIVCIVEIVALQTMFFFPVYLLSRPVSSVLYFGTLYNVLGCLILGLYERPTQQGETSGISKARGENISRQE